MIKRFLKPKPIFLTILALVGLFVVYSVVNAKLQPLKVETAKVTRGTIRETVAVSGFLKAATKASLSFGVTASKVTWLNVKVGDKVATGSALLSLDQSTLASEVTAAEAAVLQARATYKSTRAAETAVMETYKDPADLASEKIKALLNQAYQNSRAADDALTRTETALNSARLNLSKSVLTSPISGTVTTVNVSLGEVPSGVVVDVTDLNSLYFDTLVDELDINKIKLGQTVTIKLDSAKTMDLTGVVSEISPTTGHDASNNVTVETKISVTDSKAIVLRPGFEGDANIIVNSHENTLLVPFEALVEETGQNYVWVISGGKAVKKTVVKGLEGELNTEIISGLLENDVVILNPAKTFVNGQSVTSKRP